MLETNRNMTWEWQGVTRRRGEEKGVREGWRGRSGERVRKEEKEKSEWSGKNIFERHQDEGRAFE